MSKQYSSLLISVFMSMLLFTNTFFEYTSMTFFWAIIVCTSIVLFDTQHVLFSVEEFKNKKVGNYIGQVVSILCLLITGHYITAIMLTTVNYLFYRYLEDLVKTDEK